MAFTSHSTHFRFFGDDGVNAASARIVAAVGAEAIAIHRSPTVCAVLSNVAWSLLTKVVC